MIPAVGSRDTSGLPPLPEQEAAMRGIRKVNLFENRSSVYTTRSGHKVWVITHADRESTLILSAEEY